MPIPPFDGILNVIPPHLGDPKRREDLSPYSCTVEELCDRFATSPKRREILDGFLALRREFFKIGLKGFQWVDGSFVEDIEMHEGRDPDDIDVVTFVDSAKDDLAVITLIQSSNKLLLSPRHIKTTYCKRAAARARRCRPAPSRTARARPR